MYFYSLSRSQDMDLSMHLRKYFTLIPSFSRRCCALCYAVIFTVRAGPSSRSSALTCASLTGRAGGKIASALPWFYLSTYVEESTAGLRASSVVWPWFVDVRLIPVEEPWPLLASCLLLWLHLLLSRFRLRVRKCRLAFILNKEKRAFIKKGETSDFAKRI